MKHQSKKLIFVGMKTAIVSVTNDLTTDQRVDRTCMTLVREGYEVLLVGRLKTDSKKLSPRRYRTHRMWLFFEKSPAFYAEYNIRLFFFLLFRKPGLLVSNDLDTLPANYLAFRIFTFLPGKTKPYHIHDCHEYFRGVPELSARKTVTAIWKFIEDRTFPKLKTVLAVNQSVADLYRQEYGNMITVVRNVPFRKHEGIAKSKAELNIRQYQKVILYQGAVNIDRGLEEMILAMQYLKTDAILVIAGTGDIFDKLKKLTTDMVLSDKVRFTGQLPFETLHSITLMADLGLSIEKDVCLNYHFCLPNKFLDYIQAKVPVLVSPFPEMKAIVDQYGIGEYIQSHDPASLASSIDAMLMDQNKISLFRKNLEKAATDLCWENEATKLIEILKKL